MTDERRQQAIRRLRAKTGFKVHLVVYLAVNAMLVVVWALTTARLAYPASLFWPIFSIVGWGIGVALHGYFVYRRRGYTEEQIQREMTRLP
jgi:fatty acid desaturase